MVGANAWALPLTAAEPRIVAAIFGGATFVDETLLAAARRVTVPIQFLLPWDDAYVDRRSTLALFDAFASREKTSLKSVSGRTFLSSNPATALLPPSRFTSTLCVGQYTLLRGSLVSRFTFTDTSRFPPMGAVGRNLAVVVDQGVQQKKFKEA